MNRRRTGCCLGNGCSTTINRRLLPIKATYFFLFAAVAVLHPYLAVYMKDLGLTPSETSLILTVGIAGSAVARALLGALADAFNKHALLMSICCLVAAVAHVCLYFTPSVNQNEAVYVTHNLSARLLCSEDRIAICVAQDFQNSDVWNSSKVEWEKPEEMMGMGVEVIRGSCNIQCCSVVVDPTRSGYQPVTSEQAIRNRDFSSRKDQSTETTFKRTSSSTAYSELHPEVTMTYDPVVSNLSGNCENFTNMTVGDDSNWTSTFNTSEVTDCGHVWIFDLPQNLTDGKTCDSAEWTYSLCTFQCHGYVPYSNGSGNEGHGSGDVEHFGTTFVMVFAIHFFLLFFLGPIFSIVDSLAYAILGGRGKDFGQIRLWGTFSLGIFAVLSGLAMDALAKTGVTNIYLYPFIFCIAFLIVTAVLAFTIPAVEHPTLPVSTLPNSDDAPQSQVITRRLPGLTGSTHGLSNGRSPSLLTLGPHLGQLGVAAFQCPDEGFSKNESQSRLGDIRGSFYLIPREELERDVSAKSQEDSRTLVTAVARNSKGGEEFVPPKASIREDLGDSVHRKSQSAGDSVLTKSPKDSESEELVPLNSHKPGELEGSVYVKSPKPKELTDPVSTKAEQSTESVYLNSPKPEELTEPLKSQIPGDPAAPKSPDPRLTPASMSHNFALLLSNPIVVTVFISALVSGLILGQHNAFFFWYLKTLGANQLLLGLNIVVCCVSEIALLFTSGRILQVIGYRCCLYLVFTVYGVRLLVNSFIRNPWAALATEMTQSLCNGLLFPAASQCVNDLAPAGLHGTIQGIIAALHWSVGCAIGSAIAGTLYETIGPQRMFQMFSFVSFAYAALLAITLETLHRRKPKRNINNNKPI